MENSNKSGVSMEQISPEDALAELEAKKAAAEYDKAVRERMAMAVACDEMTRIVNDILVPEFLNVTHAMRKVGYRAEVVAFDAESPVYLGEMCDIGVKFRCGDRDEPCKFEWIADPAEFVFNLTIRDPLGDTHHHEIPFHAVIPRTIRKMIGDFLDQHFIESGYSPAFNDFDQFEEGFEGPFRIQMEEDGEVSDIATTDTIEEAIKMGATFSSMFKGKALTIVDKEGLTVC